MITLTYVELAHLFNSTFTWDWVHQEWFHNRQTAFAIEVLRAVRQSILPNQLVEPMERRSAVQSQYQSFYPVHRTLLGQNRCELDSLDPSSCHCTSRLCAMYKHLDRNRHMIQVWFLSLLDRTSLHQLLYQLVAESFVMYRAWWER